MTAAELRRVGELLYRATGMTFGENKRYYIERRVAERVAKTGLGNTAAYLLALPALAGEMEMLVNAFTVNETYFYREEHQLKALGRAMLPGIVRNRRPGDLVRIWSLPCSSGEEPYSVAIWLLENWPMVDAWHIEIIGSDIDTTALTQAKAGRYGERALSRLPPAVRDRYFVPLSGLEWEIVDDLKESVEFRPVNLIDPMSMVRQGRFDVIFCRNLLIYFDDRSRRAAADLLFDSLNPGGYLCLGHTESMARISDRFELVRLDDAIVYRRP
ncbi:protein-glutamate O-methyltransferase CheR [Acidisoma cellulosilytica]|uniref:protein-glutamate O-methyltransferase n=1 Tax=Acidisoma cellulosilyticum TaxID=2802395 RepID=A0A963Z881_9PROT|nr:protein-glutamate O-methyltransferase CheR [Acidisoma cellulosilyticum]